MSAESIAADPTSIAVPEYAAESAPAPYEAVDTVSAPSVASEDASAAPSTSDAMPPNDYIKWPDEEPPPPEVWEVEPRYDWERDERGYIFEERLAGAEEHKNRGNEHFNLEEWEIALRRYRRAIYFCHFDEMQMYDLMDTHKEQVHAIQTLCKLNLVACIVRMTELGSDDLPEGSLNHAVRDHSRTQGSTAPTASTRTLLTFPASFPRFDDPSLDRSLRSLRFSKSSLRKPRCTTATGKY